jgi:hypothetical protein
MVGESYNQLRLAIAKVLQSRGTSFRRFFDLEDTIEGILYQLEASGYVAATDYVNRTVDKLQADIALKIGQIQAEKPEVKKAFADFREALLHGVTEYDLNVKSVTKMQALFLADPHLVVLQPMAKAISHEVVERLENFRGLQVKYRGKQSQSVALES